VYKDVQPAALHSWRGIIQLACARFLHCGGLIILSFLLSVWFHIHGGEYDSSGAKRLSWSQSHNFKDTGIKLWLWVTVTDQ